jgi:antitoxin MazE
LNGSERITCWLFVVLRRILNVYTTKSNHLLTHISKWGNSLGIRLPKSLLQELGVSASSKVAVTIENGSIIIRPVSREYAIEELVEGITLENRHCETDWGPSVGAEVW